MTLMELRRLAVRQQSRIHFRLKNGMECVIDEHGIARIPALHSIPDFNLEQELTQAAEFSVEPAAAVDRQPVAVPRSLPRSKSMLGNSAGIGIVLNSACESKFLPEDGCDRHIDPRSQVGRSLNHARCLIQRAAATHADIPKTGFVDS